MEFIAKVLVMVIGGGLGILTSVGITAGIFGTIFYKVYRKCRYHISMFD